MLSQTPASPSSTSTTHPASNRNPSKPQHGLSLKKDSWPLGSKLTALHPLHPERIIGSPYRARHVLHHDFACPALRPSANTLSRGWHNTSPTWAWDPRKRAYTRGQAYRRHLEGLLPPGNGELGLMIQQQRIMQRKHTGLDNYCPKAGSPA